MREYDNTLPLFSLHIPKTAGTSLTEVLGAWFGGAVPFYRLRDRPRIWRALSQRKSFYYFQATLGAKLFLHYADHRKKYDKYSLPIHNLVKNRLLNRNLCIHGHFAPGEDGQHVTEAYPNAQQFITFLRDPLEMQLSMFHYLLRRREEGNLFWRGQTVLKMPFGGDIDEWVRERPLWIKSYLPPGITRDNFKGEIDRLFVHIGVVEDMQKSIDNLASKLGKRRVVIPRTNVTVRNSKPSDSAIKVFKNKHQFEYELYEYARELNL